MALRPSGRFDHDRMRLLREGLCLTRAQLAERMEGNEDSIYEWEHARSSPSITNLPKLAKALKVDVHSLYKAPGGRRLLGDIRADKGITQKKFAVEMSNSLRLIGRGEKITQTRISNWERAKEPIPNEYLSVYASLLDTTIEEIQLAAQETWRSSQKVAGWTPPIDKREQDFKGVAAGHEELAFVYKMTSSMSALVAILMAGGYSAHPGEEESKRQFSFLLWCQVYTLIQDIRDHAAAILNEARGQREDIETRAMSVIHRVDQYFTIAEDMLGAGRKKLAHPFSESDAARWIRNNSSFEEFSDKMLDESEFGAFWEPEFNLFNDPEWAPDEEVSDNEPG